MKAAVLRGPKDVKVQEFPEPIMHDDCVKIAVAYFLIGNEKIGLLGAPISAFACDLAVNAVNFYFIKKAY